MTQNQKIILAIVGPLVLIGLIVLNGYNSLVFKQEGVKREWSNVETTYQRRLDLIENVVNTAKGSAEFEQSTLQSVVEARSAWARVAGVSSLNEQVRATEEAGTFMNSALSRLLVTVEAYPQLKSTEAFRDVITELEGTENRIAVARRDFNQTVNEYNVVVRSFPSNITAKVLGFTVVNGFKADAGAEKAPKVEFDFKKTTP